jgi:hypothetical protein
LLRLDIPDTETEWPLASPQTDGIELARIALARPHHSLLDILHREIRGGA